MANKIKNMTADDLIKFINTLKFQGDITGKTQIWLSSDEEGNSYSPLITINGLANVSGDKKKLTLYPCHIRDD